MAAAWSLILSSRITATCVSLPFSGRNHPHTHTRTHTHELTAKLYTVSREQTVFLVTNHSLPLGCVTRLCPERGGSTGSVPAQASSPASRQHLASPNRMPGGLAGRKRRHSETLLLVVIYQIHLGLLWVVFWKCCISRVSLLEKVRVRVGLSC